MKMISMISSRMKFTSLSALLTLALALLVLAPSPASAAESPLTLTPTSFDFGTMAVDGEATWPGEFTVTNTGDADVTFTGSTIDMPAPWDFAIIIDDCAFQTLGTGQSCGLVLMFNPHTPGAVSRHLVINSNAPGAAPTSTLTGFAQPRLMPGVELSPGTLDFGNTLKTTTSATRTIDLKSIGQGDLEVGTPYIGGTDKTDFSIVKEGCRNRVIASGDGCEIDVTYTPSDAGASTAYVFVPTDAEGTLTKVDLTGTGTDPAPDPDPDPDPDPVSGTSNIKVAGNPKTLGRKWITVPVNCAVQLMQDCVGRLTVKAKSNALGVKVKKAGWLAVASRPYSVPAGKGQLKVRLSGLAANTLKRKGKLKLRLELTTEQGDGSMANASFVRTVRR